MASASTPLPTLGPNDRWRITHTLGAGGFATVHAAIDTRLESPVAIKLLADNYASNIEVRERFLSEAMLQRRLPGPVVPVYDTGETANGQPFMVMPLAEGGDLQQRVERWRANGGAPNNDDLYRLTLILANAIGALHAQGIVHRDLKPSNLLLFGGGSQAADVDDTWILPNETLLLADLGFAKNLAESSGLTVAGGTPGFLPPEQVRPGRVTERADIWGASAILHWFITGHRPNDSSDIRRDHLLAAGARVELADAVEQGMADRPMDRPASLEAWARQIRMALTAPVVAAPGSRASNELDQAATGRRVRLGPMAAALAIAVVGGLAGFVAATIGADGSDEPGRTVVSTTGDDGQLVHRLAGEDIDVSVSGPSTIAVGETARFTVDADSAVVDWIWISPSGTVHDDGQLTFPVRATQTGAGTVTLVATTRLGQTFTVEAPFMVTE